jgi:ADP-ribosylglycohydrolase
MARSLLDCGEYDHEDFCRRLDEDLFPLLNGEPANGPGGYTSQSIREAWRRRVELRLPWTETGGHADTTEGIERVLAIAVRYAQNPKRMAAAVTQNTMLTQIDSLVVSMTVAFCSVLALLVKGRRLTADISTELMDMVKSGELPFHAVTIGNLQPPRPGERAASQTANFASPDALLSPGYMAAAAADSDIRIEPAWKVSLVYGMPCAIYHMLPAAYYLAARFHDDFESAVLHSVNGGGQNLARTMLTGALVGAQAGLSSIPDRFIKGLDQGGQLLDMAWKLARQAASV